MTGRRALRLWLTAVTAAVSYVAALHYLPVYLDTARPPAVSEVDRVGAAHDCQPVPAPDRPLLLIDSRRGGVRLVAEAVDTDGSHAQRDLFDDERVDFYGWCRP